LEIYAQKYNKNVQGFSQTAFSQMLSYNWRGNVRELQHVVERGVLLTKNRSIESLNIPSNMVAASNLMPLNIPAPTLLAQENNHDAGKFNFTAAENLFEEIGEFIVNNLKEPVDGANQNDIFNSIEYGVVLAALRKTSGNKQAAANLLGLYRPRLYGMIKRHNIDEKF